MFAIWGIGVDLPRLLVRYGKAYSQVIDIHSISMVIAGLLTILYAFTYTIIYFQNKETLYGKDYPISSVDTAYIILTWILVFGIIVQFVLGYITRAEMVKTSLSTILFTVKPIHKYIGIFLSLLGKIIIILFLSQQNQDLFKGWFFLLAGLILIQIFMEVVYRSQTRTIIF